MTTQQRIANLSKWQELTGDGAFHYSNDKARKVVLELNAEHESRLYISREVAALMRDPERQADQDAGRRPRAMHDEQFLCFVPPGRSDIQFYVEGAFALNIDGGPVWIYTADGEEGFTRVENPVIFTRVANRRQRNPHIEMMEYQAKLNIDRRMAEMNVESERRIKALEDKLEQYAPQRNIRTPAERVGKAGPSTGAAEQPASGGPVGQGSEDEDEGTKGSGVPGGKPAAGSAVKPGGKTKSSS